jgi:hypothetical protein
MGAMRVLHLPCHCAISCAQDGAPGRWGWAEQNGRRHVQQQVRDYGPDGEAVSAFAQDERFYKLNRLPG